jgi:kynurenine formamidase
MCGNHSEQLSEAMIAAMHATPREVSMSPFGSTDQIGMLNLMTSESRQRVMDRVDGSRVFDLAVDFFLGMPSWTAFDDPPFQIHMSHTPRGTLVDNPAGVSREENELVSYSGDCISMYTHCGTHVDTLNHFGYHGKIWNGFSADEHLGSRHWNVAGADRHPPVVARGVMLDVATLHGVDVLPESYGIGPDDLQACLREQHTELEAGDVVLIRTGRMKMWDDADEFGANEPGINRDGAEFLARSGAIMIGADNLALEQYPTSDPTNWELVHTYLLAEAGVPILEVANLEELAAARLYEFAFIGSCLKIRGATGSPMRPIAMPLKS